MVKTCLRKGTWSPEEDQKLVAYINRYGIWNWTLMPKAAGLLRSGKSCRLRWMNYLKPGIKHGNFSVEEDLTIIKLHQELGNKWSTIAARLPGRTDNEIKNHWHTTLKKCLKSNNQQVLLPTTNNLQETQTEASSSTTVQTYQYNLYATKESNLDCCNNNIATPMSSQLSSGTDDSFSSSTISGPACQIDISQTMEENDYNGFSTETFGELFQSFWDQPFPMEGLYRMDDYVATSQSAASSYYDDHGNDLCIFGPIF